jgi:hypothetical protein
MGANVSRRPQTQRNVARFFSQVRGSGFDSVRRSQTPWNSLMPRKRSLFKSSTAHQVGRRRGDRPRHGALRRSAEPGRAGPPHPEGRRVAVRRRSARARRGPYRRDRRGRGPVVLCGQDPGDNPGGPVHAARPERSSLARSPSPGRRAGHAPGPGNPAPEPDGPRDRPAPRTAPRSQTSVPMSRCPDSPAASPSRSRAWYQANLAVARFPINPSSISSKPTVPEKSS